MTVPFLHLQHWLKYFTLKCSLWLLKLYFLLGGVVTQILFDLYNNLLILSMFGLQFLGPACQETE